jgi:DTW domain-containing protein YfiP
MILALGGETMAALALADYFEVFRRNYIAGKPHMVLRGEHGGEHGEYSGEEPAADLESDDDA